MVGQEAFSNRLQNVIRLSWKEAIHLGDSIGTEHLLLGIIREGKGIAIKLLQNLGADIDRICVDAENITQPAQPYTVSENNPFTRNAEKVVNTAKSEAEWYNSSVIGTEHLLFALLRDEVNTTAQILNNVNVTYDKVRTEFNNVISGVSSKQSNLRKNRLRPHETICQLFSKI